MRHKYGTSNVNYRSKIETIENSDSYCFQSFGTYIYPIKSKRDSSKRRNKISLIKIHPKIWKDLRQKYLNYITLCKRILNYQLTEIKDYKL